MVGQKAAKGGDDGVEKRKNSLRQLFRNIRAAIWQRIREEMTLMTVGKYPRLIGTLLVYIAELLLLLYSIQLLAGNILGVEPFSALAEFGPVGWLLDFLRTIPLAQSVNEAVTQAAAAESKNTAMGELIGAIGVGGMFITLLTGAEEQRICGVRTGEVLGWLHKGFLLAYTLLSLPLILVGVYAGHAEEMEAAAYAFLGVLLGLLLNLWVCFELVLNANWRERLALQYYNRLLRPGIVECLRRTIRPGKEPAEGDSAHRAMLSIAGYLRSQAETYHRNLSAEMVLLWIRSCRIPFGTDLDYPDCGSMEDDNLTRFPSGLKRDSCSISRGSDGKDHFNLYVDGGFPYPEQYLSDGQDDIITHAVLAGDVWAVLLPGERLEKQELIIIRQLLHSLYYVSKPDKRRFIVLLGLLFCLEDKALNDDAQLIEWVDWITKEDTASNRGDYVPREARCNLAWALLMIRIIAWIRDGVAAERRGSISQFCRHFGPELFLHDGQAEVCDRGETALLWYAEWAARKRCGLSLNRYLLGISTMFGAENLFPHFRQDILTYRKQFLMQVLSSIYPWQDIQDREKGAEQE